MSFSGLAEYPYGNKPQDTKIEPLSAEKDMGFLWNVIYGVLYLKYDMEKDFEPQFQENSAKLLEIIRMLPDKR